MAKVWPLVVAGLLAGTASATAAEPSGGSPTAQQEAQKLAQLPPLSPHAVRGIDHSGRKVQGKASYYAHRFDYRKMADGNRFNPGSNVAASRTLPFGTTAKVTNLENGKSANVKVEDRGPYVDGRVVDLTPKVAQELDMKKRGVTPVVVAPIAVPQPDGGVKLGAGAVEVPQPVVQQAAKEAEEAKR
jgi:rare lipoprotein A